MSNTTDKQQAIEAARGLAPTPKNIERLSAQVGGEATRWAFEQWDLRKRARTKFEHAGEMLFDRDGLEMATHERVAQWRAARFPTGCLVADLTCGIGADLIALARRGPAVGYEIDSQRVELARWNLRVHGVEAEVRERDGSSAEEFVYAFADPSRRFAGKRVRSVEEYAPNPATLAERLRGAKLAAIKLSPMLDDDVLESLGKRLEFVSFGRECREALVWLGSEVVPGRFAVHVESGEVLEADDPPETSAELGEFLYDADPAAVRSHALGTLASNLDLRTLGDSNGYLTGGRIDSPWLRRYRVLASDAADPKRARTVLRDLGGYVREVKQRGVESDQQNWIKKLGRHGDRAVSLVVWSEGKSMRLAFVEGA